MSLHLLLFNDFDKFNILNNIMIMQSILNDLHIQIKQFENMDLIGKNEIFYGINQSQNVTS